MLETLQTVATFYPFSLTDTLALIPSVILFFQYLVKGQWDKLGNQAKSVGLEMYEKIATDDEKRKAVLARVEQSVPTLLKPLMKAEALDKMVNMVYLTQVKPAAINAGLIKGEPPKEETHIEEIGLNFVENKLNDILPDWVPPINIEIIR